MLVGESSQGSSVLVTSLCRRYIGSVVCADVCKSVKVLPYLCAYVQADDVVGVGRRVASRRDHVIAQLGVGNILIRFEF